jgi:hypothetical protein
MWFLTVGEGKEEAQGNIKNMHKVNIDDTTKNSLGKVKFPGERKAFLGPTGEVEVDCTKQVQPDEVCTSVSFTGEFSNYKNMISTYTKDFFSWKI